MKNILVHVIPFIFIFSGVFSAQNESNLFAVFLAKYVDESGNVDYRSVHKDYDFQSLLEYIAQVGIESMPENERLAFYINSYNILVIKNVIDHWPIQSPMDIPGFFKEYRFMVAGEKVSLDDIEYKKIFRMEAALVHFGLVCAAESCPRLMDVPFEAPSLWDQLNKNGREFFQDQSKNRLDKSTNTLYLSEIFKWFRPNFENRFGSLIQTAQNFLLPEDSLYLARHRITISFIEYNWTLNIQIK